MTLSDEKKRKICFTLDDPNDDLALNTKLLETLNLFQIKVALFVSGHKVNSRRGRDALELWKREGHWICNHSFSHLRPPKPNEEDQIFLQDMIKMDVWLKEVSHHRKWVRFPFIEAQQAKSMFERLTHTYPENDFQLGFYDYFFNDLKWKLNPASLNSRDKYLELFQSEFSIFLETSLQDSIVLGLHHLGIHGEYLSVALQWISDKNFTLSSIDEVYLEATM